MKLALCIGISYIGIHTNDKYGGCPKDAARMGRFLCSQGFKTVIFLDSGGVEPTMDNIKCALVELSYLAQSGDHIIVYYSGNGDTIVDDYSILDTITSINFIQSSDDKIILDDDIFEWFLKNLNPMCTVMFLIDSFHRDHFFDFHGRHQVKVPTNVVCLTCVGVSKEYSGVLSYAFLRMVVPNINIKYICAQINKLLEDDGFENYISLSSSRKCLETRTVYEYIHCLDTIKEN